MRDWRKSTVAAGIGLAIYLGLQLAIPISRVDDDARRFGWQMFSTAQFAPDIVVVTDSGEIDIDHRDHIAVSRADVDFEKLLPPHLCSVVPGALAVQWDGGELEC